MWIRTLALPAAVGGTLALAGCAVVNGDDAAGLSGTGFGEDPWRQTRAATSPVVLPVTQTGAGIAVIRQGLARARAAQVRAAEGAPRLSEAAIDAQPVWHPAAPGNRAAPARTSDDDRRSGWGAAPQRAKG